MRFIICPVGVFSEVFLAETTVNRTHNLLQSPGLSVHVCYMTSNWEKEVLSISGVMTEVRENFSLYQEIYLSGMHAFHFLSEGFWELMHFLIHLFYFLFSYILTRSYKWKEQSKWATHFNPFISSQTRSLYVDVIFNCWFYSKAGCFSTEFRCLKIDATH